MRLDVIVELFDIVMQLVLQRVIVDDELIDVRSNFLHLVDGQNQPVRGHEDERFRQFLPCVLVALDDLCIQKRLIIAVQRQMSLISPVCELVNDVPVKAVVNDASRPLLRVDIRRAEFAGGIAAVDRLDVHDLRHRRGFLRKEPGAECVLRFLSCFELQFQIRVGREVREPLPCFISESA